MQSAVDVGLFLAMLAARLMAFWLVTTNIQPAGEHV
jgi:hypothetical protein